MISDVSCVQRDPATAGNSPERIRCGWEEIIDLGGEGGIRISRFLSSVFVVADGPGGADTPTCTPSRFSPGLGITDRAEFKFTNRIRPQRACDSVNDSPKAPSGETEMSDLWFTPKYIAEPYRQLVGGQIDLDPASCAEANAVVQAQQYFTQAQNGLLRPWFGHVFLNAPFSVMAQFVEKTLLELESGRVSSLLCLTNANTEVAWFRALATRANAICWPAKRIAFWLPGGHTMANNPRGQALFYFGQDAQGFAMKFQHIGAIMPVVGPGTRPWLHPMVRAQLYDLICRCFCSVGSEPLLLNIVLHQADGLCVQCYDVSKPATAA
jgi:hypothetical protein